jgi:hypothetical protein
MDFHKDVLETPPAWFNAMEERLCMYMLSLPDKVEMHSKFNLERSVTVSPTLTNLSQPPCLPVLTSQRPHEQRTPGVANRSDEHNGE